MSVSMEAAVSPGAVKTNGVPIPGDAQALLGAAGTGSLPMWLKPEMFLSQQFDPDACVADLRRFAPLSTLQSELQSYLSTLKAKMVEVINEDYQDYVNLSAKLTNVDGAVLRMRKPLLELKDKLSVVCDAVRGELASLAAGLRRRKEVAVARSLLELLQELAHLASKVDKLLAEMGSDDARAADSDTRARLLERVAGEVSRLSFQANRGKDLAFVRAMEPRITAARTELQKALSEALNNALAAKDHGVALHCLSAYSELGLAEPAEAALRSQVVAPIVQKLISDYKDSHQHHRTSSGGQEQGFAGLLKRIENETTAALGTILTTVLTPQAPLARSFDLLGNVILAEVDACLPSQLPAAFSPGMPAAFHDNFLVAQAFIESLEKQCKGKMSLDKFRSSAAYTSFNSNKRWNTSAYYSLVYQDVAGALEDAAYTGKPELTTPDRSNQHIPQLPISIALIEGLKKTTSPEVFLTVLSDKFLKLALQLGQRYRTWCEAACTARQAGMSAGQQTQAQAQQGATSGQPGSVTGASHSRSGSIVGSTVGNEDGNSTEATGTLITSPANSATNTQLKWVASLSSDELLVLYNDMTVVASHIRGEFTDKMLELLAGLPEDVRFGVKEGLQQMAAGIDAQGTALLSILADEVIAACCGAAVTQQIKGLSATYRTSSKMPVNPSMYVSMMWKPLQACLHGARMSHLPQPTKHTLVLQIVEAVSGRYQALAEDVLNTSRNLESSLRKLKKVQAEESKSKQGDMSTSDRITLQLYLDVREYGRQAVAISGPTVRLDLRSLTSFSKLKEAVMPPQHVLDAAQINDQDFFK